MPADMVIEAAVYSPLVVHNSGFGIVEDVSIAMTDEANSIVSRHFNIKIRDEDDLEKIKAPVVSHDARASEQQYRQLRDICDGIIEVRSGARTASVSGFRPGTR